MMFVAVREARVPVFGQTAGFIGKSFDSSEFPADRATITQPIT